MFVCMYVMYNMSLHVGCTAHVYYVLSLWNVVCICGYIYAWAVYVYQYHGYLNEYMKRFLFLCEMTAKLQGVVRREQNGLLLKRTCIANKVLIENSLGLNVNVYHGC